MTAKLGPQQQREVQLFGGITEDIYQNGSGVWLPATKAENVLVDDSRKLISRYGWEILVTGATNNRTVEQDRVAALIDFEEAAELILVTADSGTPEGRVYEVTTTGAGGFTELVGPVDSNSAFVNGDTTDNISWAEGQQHLFVNNNGDERVVKLYKDTSANLQIRTAGLPKLADADNYTEATEVENIRVLVNLLRTNFLAHIADFNTAASNTRNNGYHKAEDTESSGLVGSAVSAVDTATDLAASIVLIKELLAGIELHINDGLGKQEYHGNINSDETTTRPDLHAPNEDQLLPGFVEREPENSFEAGELLDELVSIYNSHAYSAVQHAVDALGPTGLLEDDDIPSDNYLFLTRGPSVADNKIAQFYDVLNQFKVDYNEHLADTDAHNKGADGTNTVAAADATTPETFETLLYTLLGNTPVSPSGYAAHDDDAELGATIFHKATETVDHSTVPEIPTVTSSKQQSFRTGVHARSTLGVIAWLNEYRSKFFDHVKDTVIHDVITKVLIAAPELDLAIANYSYAFVYKLEYDIDDGDGDGTITFLDRGPPLIKTFRDRTKPDIYPLEIENIPNLANGSTDLYDTANVVIEIYRTVANGATFYKVGEIDNTTTTFTDTTDDDNLILNEALYTTGGVRDNDPPPISRYLATNGLNMLYGDVQDSEGNWISNRVLISKEGDLDSVPGSFSYDFDKTVKGIGTVNGKFIVGTERGIFRIEGTFTDLGTGGMAAVPILKNIGLASHGSFVEVENVLYFAGTDGFYVTDGFSASKLSDFEDQYADLSNKQNISGVYDRKNRVVKWAVQVNSGAADNDTCYVLDVEKLKPTAPRPEDIIFTTETSEDTPTGTIPGEAFEGTDFLATCLGYFNDRVVRGDTQGYVFKQDSDFNTDPIVDINANTEDWEEKSIQWDWRSTHMNFGSDAVRKWSTSMALQLHKKTDVSIDLTSILDKGNREDALKKIIYRTSSDVYPDQLRANDTIISAQRHFPRKHIRTWYKQIKISQHKALLETFDSSGETVTIAQTADPETNTATLSAGSWNLAYPGYEIAFEADNYAQGFTITSVAAGVLTFFDDADDAAVASGQRYVIRGFPKGEQLHVLALNHYYSLMSTEQLSHPGDSVGET